MKSAIIGLGVIAEVHIEVLKNIGAEVTCVCDIDMEKAEKFVSAHSIECKIYTDYKEMLENEEIDIVHICTPHYLHAEMCVFALNRNINVLCEKPLCIKKEEIKQICNAVKNSKAQLGVCLQNRYTNINMYVKELISKEKVIDGFGAVLWCRDRDYYESADWRGKWATEGGGAVINQALHTLDLLQWFCGMPQSVNGSIFNVSHDYIEVEDSARARFVYDGGAFEFYASVSHNDDFAIQIMLIAGDKRIIITDKNLIVNGQPMAFETIKTQNVKECYGNGHMNLIADFYDCINNNRHFEIDAFEGSKVIKLTLGIYESKGKTIEL
ncbi:MAG: Gfo/Idh/MocA family oxidoreductase [Clostridia bacterium]|nr:Gfo/Idh/MocA family oxidoreductase [Clostridia bacterium]